MFRFWEIAISPVIDAVRARRIVHIGTLAEDARLLLLSALPADGELHVVDASSRASRAPKAEPSGRYFLHRAHSLDVLPSLPPADVAFIDGDHNWYTVSRELRLLVEAARTAGAPAPVLFLHDVGWPYGRRDVYEDVSRVPEGDRQPYARGGLRRGSSELVGGAGLNHTQLHAQTEGGPRNGVLTALEDFVAASDDTIRQVVLPVAFGLAIVADEERVQHTPALGAVLDHLESDAGHAELLELSERIRVEAVVAEHDQRRKLEGRMRSGVNRYLSLLKGALLDEHYLENEVRIEYLTSLPAGAAPDRSALRDPARQLPVRYDRLVQARQAGWSAPEGRNIAYFPYTTMGRHQLDHLHETLTALRADGIPGDLAEFGVGRGGGAIFLRGYLEAQDMRDRQVWVADRFLGAELDASADGADLNEALARFGADLNQVRDGFARFDLLDDRVRFLQGVPEDVLRDAPITRLALLRLGRTLGTSVAPVLEALHPRIVSGGAVIIEGTSDPRVLEAVEAARARLRVTAPLERVDWNSVTWRVAAEPEAAAATIDAGTSAAASPVSRRVPLVTTARADTLALSVVVVFFNMRREAARTLLSLSRAYQRGVDALDYEVIAIDNGSAPDQRLDEEFVRSFGPEFRLLDLGVDASPSPTAALNRAAAVARGDVVAFMIDGAHVLTPGVLRLGMTAISTYAPAIVATQQWYVGPGQQGDALHAGYDQVVEDRLFDRINWPVDGYRLFEISHFIGERDWFDGIVESNCLFVPRTLLEQVGGFDDSFSMPGGGYANLDLFERLGYAPGVQVASILGEGTFHQVHGGTTTNVADAAKRRDLVASYGEHFEELRGRGLVGLTKPVHFVGSMATKAARRTRSRREISLTFDRLRDPAARDATEGGSTPVPDELKLAAIEAVWQNGAWRDATWLGHRVARLPTDLYSYQELLTQVRPDVVVVAGDDDGLGGRALFAAMICDQLGHGRVVAVGRAEAGDVPDHARIVRVVGAPEAPAVAAEVRAALDGAVDAVVFLGLGAVERVIGAFELYAPLVPVDSYVVVENTVVNGRPVESGFGPGPYEAVVNILGRHRAFMADPSFERYTLTFNKGGFLRRVRPSPA